MRWVRRWRNRRAARRRALAYFALPADDRARREERARELMRRAIERAGAHS